MFFRAGLLQQGLQVLLHRRFVMLGGGGPGVEQREGQHRERALGRQRQLLAGLGIVFALEAHHRQGQTRRTLVGGRHHRGLGIFPGRFEIPRSDGVEKRQGQQRGIGRIVGQGLAVIARRLRQVVFARRETRRQIGGKDLGLGIGLQRVWRIGRHGGASGQQQSHQGT